MNRTAVRELSVNSSIEIYVDGLRVARRSYFKNMAEHRDAECVEGNEGKRECGGGISIPNGLGGHAGAL